MYRLLNRGCRDSFRGYRGCREGVAADAATNIYGECAQAGKLTFPHKNHTTGPSAMGKQAPLLRSEKLMPAPLHPGGLRRNSSPRQGRCRRRRQKGRTILRGKIETIRSLRYVRSPPPHNTPREGTPFSLIFRKWFQKAKLTMGYFFISFNVQTVYNRGGVYKAKNIIIHYI